MSTDQSFITQNYIIRIDMFNELNREIDPDYTLIHMPPPAGTPNGKKQDFSAHFQQAGYAIATTSSHIDTVIRYLDWTFSEEGRDALSWGIEGEMYTDVEGEKSWVKEYPNPSDLRTETGLSLFGTYTWFDYDAHMALFSDEVKEAYEEYPKYDAPFIPEPAFTSEEQEKLSIQGEEITKYRDQEIAKFIIGQRDLSEWDAYVDQLKSLGVEEMVSMYEKAHSRMLEADLN